jgi:hypothetical protein
LKNWKICIIFWLPKAYLDFLFSNPSRATKYKKPWKTFSMTWSKLDMIWCTLLVFKVQEDYTCETNKSVHLICKFCQLLVPWVVWAFIGNIKLLFKSNQFHTEQSITESSSCKGFFDGVHMDEVWGVLVHPSTKLSSTSYLCYFIHLKHLQKFPAFGEQLISMHIPPRKDERYYSYSRVRVNVHTESLRVGANVHTEDSSHS